ncbi:hypothetical protein CC2G_000153 [Coprinopsis cinerea AmutBmut pab1-1]|nr:hypothetical protein CC2G_000153 [Coprinopsis cinerea AmutBmut pab1-1]
MPLRSALKVKAQMEQGDADTGTSPFPFASSRILDSPRVHFPPTPTLTTTGLTHAPHVYDRAPILVQPNVCALPERGARMYFVTDGGESVSPSAKECYFQPRRSGPIHSMQQAWADTPGAQSISPLTLSPLARGDLVLGSHSSDSSSSESEGSELGYDHSRLSVRSSPYNDDDDHDTRHAHHKYTDRSPSSYMQTDLTSSPTESSPPSSFSLSLPFHPTRPKSSKSGVKKKKERSLQADWQARRRTLVSSSTASDYDDLCNPALEGCLGGF